MGTGEKESSWLKHSSHHISESWRNFRRLSESKDCEGGAESENEAVDVDLEEEHGELFADLHALESGRVGDAQLNAELAAVLAQERARRLRVRRSRRLAKKSTEKLEQDRVEESRTFTEKLAAE